VKRIVAALALGALVASGAFAELTFGVSGVQYFADDSIGLKEAFDGLKDGTNVYYGGFIEIIGRHMGLGGSFNYYDMPEDFGFSVLKMWSYDANLYLSYHFFGGRAFIDPFVQMGIGMMAFNYKDPQGAKDFVETFTGPVSHYDSSYIDKDDPMYASLYWDAGAGLGVNLGIVGVYVKGMYNFNLKGTVQGKDDLTGEKYDIQPYPDIGDFKWIFGAKIIL
jgi:hypothetical protein